MALSLFQALPPDGRLLFAARAVRLFAYGMLSVVLVLYLAELGFGDKQTGLLLSLTFAGDMVISLALAAVADRAGRRRMLLLGGLLMILAGLVFGFSRSVFWLTLAAFVGTISPSGHEVGPFLSIEQSALAQIVPSSRRTQIFAWYTLAGSGATAVGALAGGALAEGLQKAGVSHLDSYRAVVLGYAALGFVLESMFARVSRAVEIEPAAAAARTRLFGLDRSRRFVFKLSGLFMVDAFAGALIVQSFIAYWFHRKFGVSPAVLGGIFFVTNVLAAISALAAARMASRFGLVNTMVWTHVPSNVLLMLVPLMPTLPWTIVVLLARSAISQMDVPTRQSYTMAVVDPHERSAAAGIAGGARTAAGAFAPLATGSLFAAGLFNVPFYVAGVLKILYDLALYRSFRAFKPPEER
jgi:MFS family permease